VPPPVAPANPVVAAVKKAGASSVFQVAAVLFTVGLLAQVISAFRVGSFLDRIFDFINTLSDGEMTYELSSFRHEFGFDLLDVIGSTLTGMMLFLLIPTILLCVGVWLFHLAAKNNNEPLLRTTGLSILNGVSIFQLILKALSALGVLVSVVLILITGAAARNGDAMAVAVGVAIVPLILYVPVLALSIAYYVSAIKAIGAVKRAVATGQRLPQISAFLPVMNILYAIGSLVGVAFTGGWGVLAGLLNGTAMVLVSVALFNFRQAARQEQYAQQQALYPAPQVPYAPQPAPPVEEETTF
ncbi:MAG: hypothetical protein LBS96_03265, partial [Oscillospiraceae bacterium]|jgi:hypothetical protein|nr:hypothetical protein [Oscillospiraceae bacterium]